MLLGRQVTRPHWSTVNDGVSVTYTAHLENFKNICFAIFFPNVLLIQLGQIITLEWQQMLVINY